ncbi:unnamed protein product, partial [Polarella glacialis]
MLLCCSCCCCCFVFLVVVVVFCCAWAPPFYSAMVPTLSRGATETERSHWTREISDSSGSRSQRLSFRRASTIVRETLSLSDPSLLRSVPIGAVLRNGGLMLRHSAGSEETYALSSQVARITKFVSHNWDTPRWSKFLALVMHFNFFWAVVSSVVAMLVTFALCGPIKLLPQQQQPIADDKIFE